MSRFRVFEGTDSTRLVPTAVPADVEPRKYWLAHIDACPAPWISSSRFVARDMIEHLMRRKADLAIATKSTASSLSQKRITNMEGLLHSFVTPLVLTKIHGDYVYLGNHGIEGFPRGPGHDKCLQARQVIVSAMIHPDFEGHEVMWQFCLIDRRQQPGSDDYYRPWQLKFDGLSTDRVSLRGRDTACKSIEDWDLYVKNTALFHLLGLPGLVGWVQSHHVVALPEIRRMLAEAIQGDHSPRALVRRKSFVVSEGRHKAELSLEVLFCVVLEQIQNEFLALEAICPEAGYVYTYDPPVIFRQALGRIGGDLLSLVHAAALKDFARRHKLTGLKVFGYNDFANPHQDIAPILVLIRAALRGQPVKVMSKADLFKGSEGTIGSRHAYSPPAEFKRAILVLHNNSDAFGQNIEFESGGGSMDAVIGQYSSAAASLRRDRDDLVSEHYLMYWPSID